MDNFRNPFSPYVYDFSPKEPVKKEVVEVKRSPVFVQDEDLDKIAMYLVSSQQRFRENIIIPRALGGGYIKSNEEKAIEKFMESCTFKSIMSCVVGT